MSRIKNLSKRQGEQVIYSTRRMIQLFFSAELARVILEFEDC